MLHFAECQSSVAELTIVESVAAQAAQAGVEGGGGGDPPNPGGGRPPPGLGGSPPPPPSTPAWAAWAATDSTIVNSATLD